MDPAERDVFRQLLKRVAATSRPYYPADIPRQIVTELESLSGVTAER